MSQALRFLTGLLLIVGLTACGTSAVFYEDEAEAPREITADHPEVTQTPGHLVFADLRLVPQSAGPRPETAHISGQIMGGLFLPPYGPVQGVASERPGGRILTRGWLVLRTRAFHSATGPAPEPPYVPGWQDDETKGFVPAGPLVLTAPDTP